mgnify:CR=1 FL=1
MKKSRTFLLGIKHRSKDLFDPHSSPHQATGYSSGKVRDKGFSLIETILYIGVFGILVTVISQLVVGTITNYKELKARDELVSSANEIFGFFLKETKNADSIYLSRSVFDSSSGFLSLVSPFQFGDEVGSSGYVDLYVSEGKAWLKRGGETAMALTSDNVEVTRFEFARSVPKQGLEGVRFYLGIRDKINPEKTISLSTFTMLRGGYKQ